MYLFFKIYKCLTLLEIYELDEINILWKQLKYKNYQIMSEKIDSNILKKYEIMSKIGKGAYGIVWKARELKSQRIVALKKVFDAFSNPTDA